MRLIDADALYMDIIHRFDYCDDFLEMLESAPSAEPEIIRCKDCAKRECCRTSTIWAVAPGDNWYCADAERREDE